MFFPYSVVNRVNVSIRDLCLELKEDTTCDDSDIVELLRSIAQSIEVNGL